MFRAVLFSARPPHSGDSAAAGGGAGACPAAGVAEEERGEEEGEEEEEKAEGGAEVEWVGGAARLHFSLREITRTQPESPADTSGVE